MCAAECSPGEMECRNGDGGAQTAIRRCNAQGRWEADTDCAIGRCQQNGSVAACVAECIPGEPVCTGATSANGIAAHHGTTSFTMCSAKGLIDGVATACGGTTSCRRDRTGHTISVEGNACLECVGTGIERGNEEGIVDSRCTTLPADAGGGAGAQTCGANNTWTTASATSCQGSSCSEATTASGPQYPTCVQRNGHMRSESYFRGKGSSCEGPKRSRTTNFGAPVACGLTPDCCGTQCSFPVPGLPARCN